MSRFDYVAVGHVTVDVLVDAPDGPRRQAGGGALYSGLQAARLGLRTLILTSGRRAELDGLLEPYRDELQVQMLDTEQSTTLETRGSGRRRTQRLLSWAGPLPSTMVPRRAAILHLAPVARETPGRVDVSAELVGITPQGLMRRWDRSGTIEEVALSAGALPQPCDAVVINAAEQDCLAPALPDQTAPSGRLPLVAVTAGSEPTQIRLPDGRVTAVPPPQPGLDPIDDLGAGDVFAAAFFIALHGGAPPAEAAAFGNAAAAVRIGGRGPGAIGRHQEIEAALTQRP